MTPQFVFVVDFPYRHHSRQCGVNTRMMTCLYGPLQSIEVVLVTLFN
jgi:hypothetical protein